MTSLIEVSLDGSFLGSAVSNIFLVLLDGSLQFNDDLVPLGKFVSVNFDFVFELELEFSGGGVGVNFIFLGLSNLVGNGSF